eukprot:scaffold62528_cov59-Phaeocystis_antarctica.AAC.1
MPARTAELKQLDTPTARAVYALSGAGASCPARAISPRGIDDATAPDAGRQPWPRAAGRRYSNENYPTQGRPQARPCRAGAHAYAPSRPNNNLADSPASSPYEVYAPRADERHAAGRPRADGVCAAGAPPGPCLARHAWPTLPTHPCPAALPRTSPPPRDISQQPSSLLVAGEELGADSIKDDAQIAPAQAIPQPPVPRPSTRAGTVQIANPNILTLTPTLTLILAPTLTLTITLTLALAPNPSPSPTLIQP